MSKTKKKATKASPSTPTKRAPGAPSSLMVIQPVIAKRWLEKLGKNRKVIKRHLETMEKVFRAGKFAPPGKGKATGDTIKFDVDGNLIDGQHRLQACVNTGVAFESYVVFGVDPEVFPMIDQGKSKTAAHILSAEGVENYGTVAATVRSIHGIKRAISTGTMPGSLGWTLKDRLQSDEIRAFTLEHEALLAEAVTTVRSTEARTILKPPSNFAALYFIFAKLNHQRTKEFFILLAEGAGLETDDPIYRLRQTLISCLGDKLNRRSAPWKAAVTIKAWNAWLRGDTVRQIRFRTGEDFPKPRARAKS